MISAGQSDPSGALLASGHPVGHSDQDILCHTVSPYSPYPEDQTTGSHPLFYINMFSREEGCALTRRRGNK